MVVLVEERMRDTTGLVARAATASAKTGASINQGSTESSLMFGVYKKDETDVLRSLYDEFFETVAAHVLLIKKGEFRLVVNLNSLFFIVDQFAVFVRHRFIRKFRPYKNFIHSIL